MREIKFTYIGVSIDEIIVEIAKYIEQGYRTTSWSQHYSSYDRDYVSTVRLVKLK